MVPCEQKKHFHGRRKGGKEVLVDEGALTDYGRVALILQD
jgi:hypothetical protein